jgi:hypothetical protein
MTRMVARVPAALLVFGMALLVLFAPRVALAHESGPTRYVADPQIGSRHGGDAGFVAPCPGGPGHVCGCGNLEVLAPASEPAAAAFPRAIISTALRAWTKRSTAMASVRSLLSLSSARPRAPPQPV